MKTTITILIIILTFPVWIPLFVYFAGKAVAKTLLDLAGDWVV